MSGAPLELAWSVPAEAENLSAVRLAVCDLARRAGAGESACGDVALAVGEACANVIVHAYREGEPGPLLVEARVDGDELEVIVGDEGRGVAPHPGSEGLGLGLPLIGSLSREMVLSVGAGGRGTQLLMRFGLEPDPGPTDRPEASPDPPRTPGGS